MFYRSLTTKAHTLSPLWYCADLVTLNFILIYHLRSFPPNENCVKTAVAHRAPRLSTSTLQPSGFEAVSVLDISSYVSTARPERQHSGVETVPKRKRGGEQRVGESKMR